MSLMVANHRIDRIAIVDDDELVRRAYRDVIIDMNVEPLEITGPLHDIGSALRAVDAVDAVLCDHRLSGSPDFGFNGAEFVAALYRAKKPAVLCTQWGRARPHEFTVFREWLPSVLEPPPEPEAVEATIATCLEEFRGHFGSGRRVWRTLVRILGVSSDGPLKSLEMIIPAWNPNQVVVRPLDAVPRRLWSEMESGRRLHAYVNINAEDSNLLFFRDWEDS